MDNKFEIGFAAFEQVKQTVAALKNEHAAVVSEIAEVNGAIEAAMLEYLPLEDLKDGILDFIVSSGERYAARNIRAAITCLATGGMRGSGTPEMIAALGKPLRYVDIESAISNRDVSMGRAQLLSTDKEVFDDQVLYFLCTDLVREGLRKVMTDMAPAEFGYNTIHPNKIGSPRCERRVFIAELDHRLSDLLVKKAELEEKLCAIGSPVQPEQRGKA